MFYIETGVSNGWALNCILKNIVSFVTRRAMKLFILLIGLILVLEGLPYAAAPEAMQDWLKKISETDPSQLRSIGLAAVVTGLIVCFVVQKTSLFS